MNIQVNQYSHTKNCNTYTVINFENYSSKHNLRTKRILSINKNDKTSGFNNKIKFIYNYDKTKIAKKLLKLSVIFYMRKQNYIFCLFGDKRQCSTIKNKCRCKNITNARNRSNLLLQSDLYYLKHTCYVFKRKYSSWLIGSSKRKMILNRYCKSKPSNDACKISSQKSRKSSEIKSSILTSLKLNHRTHKLNNYSRGSTFIHSSEQNNQERYKDILREVKKILNKDVRSKRKLKYIFKKRNILKPIYNLKFHSSSIDNATVHEKKHDKFYKENVECDKSKFCNNHLNIIKTLNGLDVNTNSNIVTIKTSDKNLVYKKLKPSTLISQFRVGSNSISRTPSPALPLIRDEAVLKETIDSTKKLPFVKEMNLSENLSNFSFKLCNSMEFADYSKRLSIKKQFLSISTSPNTSSNSIDNTLLHLCKEAKDILYSNDIKLDEQCSICQLPSRPQSRTNSESTSPLKITSSKHWSPIILMQKNRSNLSVKVDNSVLNRNEETLIYATQTSPSKTSSFLKLSRSESSDFNTCFKHYSSSSKRRSRSLSIPRYSRSTSRSLSNTSFIHKRSSSKESSRTFLSSLNHSQSSYYCTSRSSSFSCRTSRQTSFDSSRSRSPSIPRRHGSPSFLDRRRITSARKRPVPYHRSTPSPITSSSSVETNSYNDWSQRSHRLSQTPSCSSLHLIP